MQAPLLSTKASRFTESVIRGMSIEARKYGAINLAQGMPDFPAPIEIKEAACRAILGDFNQYAVTWGAPDLRQAIAEHAGWHLGLEVDPDSEITVTCGSTEAMLVALLSVINPGDEVILSQPFYENYWPDCILAGATPRFVPCPPSGLEYDPDELAAAFNDRTKAIVLCNPNNPTGAVMSRRELETIAALCRKWDVIAITDEIYEHILFDGRQHVAMATLDGMRERSVIIGGMSKTYSVTGWRIGTMIAPSGIVARLPPRPRLRLDRRRRPAPGGRRRRLPAPPVVLRPPLRRLPGPPRPPLRRPPRNRLRPCHAPGRLLRHGRHLRLRRRPMTWRSPTISSARSVSPPSPGSSFFHEKELGRHLIRFCFCKRDETLDEAIKTPEDASGHGRDFPVIRPGYGRHWAWL